MQLLPKHLVRHTANDFQLYSDILHGLLLGQMRMNTKECEQFGQCGWTVCVYVTVQQSQKTLTCRVWSGKVLECPCRLDNFPTNSNNLTARWLDSKDQIACSIENTYEPIWLINKPFKLGHFSCSRMHLSSALLPDWISTRVSAALSCPHQSFASVTQLEYTGVVVTSQSRICLKFMPHSHLY